MEKQYIASERAHFMCPNMHFGILAEIPSALIVKKVRECVEQLSQAHPFLRSLISYDRDSVRLYYNVSEVCKVEVYERLSEESIWEDYRSIGRKEWNVLEHGLLKVFFYPMKQGFQILFVAHHLLGDGRCLLELVNEFANLYVAGIKPIYVEEHLIQSLLDLPPKSELSGVSKLLVNRLNRQWKKEKERVSYEAYARFADQFVKENPVSYELCTIDEHRVVSMKKLCKTNEISINDLLMAKTYLAMNTPKIIIAADIRSQLSCYREGAYGNYATAMGIVCKGKSTDPLEKAKEVRKQVMLHRKNNRKLMLVLACYLAMDPQLIDAAAIGTLGNFNSNAAKFVGGNMFGYQKREGISITNLGNINTTNLKKAIFIPPASPATIQTIGVLTVNNRMQLCSSYYTNAISNKTVKEQLQSLV